jgi:hypothetical protein
MVPKAMVMKTLSSMVLSDSGMRWKNAPPSIVPEAKQTSISNSFLKIFSFKARKNTPTNEIKLTTNVEAKISNKTSVLQSQLHS